VLALAVAALAIAQAYLLAAPELPEIHDEKTSLIVARIFGSAAILCGVAVAAAVVGTDSRRAWSLAAASLVGVAIVNLADVGAGATVLEALAYGAVGAALALGLLEPVLILALPVVVAVVDVVSITVGPSSALAHAGRTKPGDPLSLEMPDWGNGLPAGRLGFSDAVVAGALIAWALHYGLRTWATVAAMWAAMMIASVVNIALVAAVPVLPVMAVAFFAVNADRLAALVHGAITR
jgi:hypothetical protein